MTRAILPADVAWTIVDPQSYAEWEQLHQTLVMVRKELPFACGNVPGYDPFWVASKFDDIQHVARQHDMFLSGQAGLGMQTKAALQARAAGIGTKYRTLLSMNEPEHAHYRTLTQAWFQPKALRRMEDRIRQIARSSIEALAATGDACDFAADIVVHFPLRVIMSILGVPESDAPMMLRLTQEFFGSKDKRRNRAKATLTSTEAAQAMEAVVDDLCAYFHHVSAERQRHPTDDLATVIAHAQIDGRPINDLEAMGMYIEMALAGHDTTSSSLAGGIWALAEHPEQLQWVQEDPSHIPGLVEETLRWVTPVHQLVRTAAHDCTFRDQEVAQGDRGVLLFVSGNRDEDVFEDPFRFRVDRKPNRHIAFGYGVHMCLGMYLARMQPSML